jgi:hypothetical protein
MKTNVGSIDAAIRIALGLAMISATLNATIGLWGWLGVILIATGIVRICPVYLPFGWHTCKVDK